MSEVEQLADRIKGLPLDEKIDLGAELVRARRLDFATLVLEMALGELRARSRVPR